MKISVKILFLLFLPCIVFSCYRVEQYSEIPEIEFISFHFSDSIDILGNPIKVGVLSFLFTDGDADIGLYPDESLLDENNREYKHNCFLSRYKKENGVYLKVSEIDSSYLNFRIPYIEPIGENSVLNGTISIRIEDLNLNYDTIKYEFYIMDRNFHFSNIENTTDIAVN